MLEEYIPINAIDPLDPARQSAIAQAITNKFMLVQFVPITGVPLNIEQDAKKVGMVRALLGKKLIEIVGDGKELNTPNKKMWNSLLELAQKTTLDLAQKKNTATKAPTSRMLKV